MSLGGGVSTALDSAVANSIASGVTYAIAAGNSNANACNSSPARVAHRLTVGSHHETDARSSFSNFRDLRRRLRPRLEHHLDLEHERTPPPTRSAAPPWRRRTSRAWRPLYLSQFGEPERGHGGRGAS
jgi:subtilisin family serine protease